MKPLVAALAALGVAIALSSCRGGRSSPSEPPKASGPLLVESSKELKPDAQPGWKAVLSIYATEIPVELEQEVKGSEVTLRMLSFNQEVEVERYRSTPASFDLVQMAGEQFEPPLPLLPFPVYEGAQLPWKGKLIIGELARPAEAAITAKKEPLKAKGIEPVDSIRVTVALKIDGGAPTMATRMLDFWFVEGKGLLKREIDKGSARLPLPPEPASERR